MRHDELSREQLEEIADNHGMAGHKDWAGGRMEPFPMAGHTASQKNHSVIAGHNNAVAQPVQSPDVDLSWLRVGFPYVPILPMPNDVVSVLLDGTNAQDIDIPRSAVLVRFEGTTNDWVVGLFGQAEYPTATNSKATLTNPTANKSVVCPRNTFFYCRGLGQISVNSKTASCVVSASFWLPPEIKRFRR